MQLILSKQTNMKKITSLLLLFVFSFIGNAQINGYSVGDVVDDFTVTDTNGVEHNLYEYTQAGKYVFLDFFFVDCGPCRDAIPIYNEFYDKYGCNQGDLIMLSINNGNDDNEYVEWYSEEFGGEFNHTPHASNEGGATAVDAVFNPAAYPTFCLIAPDNTLLNQDIWPLAGVITFENALPASVDPEVMECTILDVTEVIDANFSIFPTISNGQNISVVMKNQEAVTIRVYDITGKEVYTNDISSNTIEFSLNVSPGTYFVKVNTASSTATKKIIIK